LKLLYLPLTNVVTFLPSPKPQSMSDHFNGSFWNKWDLHLHSPYTHLAGKYNCDMATWAKAIKDNNIKVVGLTNYFIISEQEYNEAVASLGQDVFVIPNVEFRTNDRNADNDYINIHVLFNPKEVSIKKINEILTRIELNNIANTSSLYCSMDLLQQIGFDNATISVDALIDQLKSDLLPKDYIIAGVPNGYGGFHPDKKPRNIHLAEKMDQLSQMMIARKEDTAFFLSTDNERAKLGFPPKPVVVCSDAHTISDIGKKTTWIKGELSFEGLRQILYEPKYRVSCNDSVQKPYRAIESITFSFPSGTILRNTQTNSDQPFCLTELRHEIPFSPYFTCIIGGRGAGKSTIVNMIAQHLGDKTAFFKNNKIVVDGDTNVVKDYDKNFLSIKGTNEVEFISQGRVEELAEGGRLTDLVFTERIKAIGSEFSEQEKILLDRIGLVDQSIKIVFELEGLNGKLDAKSLSLENDEKIVASIENDTYKDLSAKIAETSAAIAVIKDNKAAYSGLLTHLSSLLAKYEIAIATNDYATRLNEILVHISGIDEITKTDEGYMVDLKVYTETDNKLGSLDDELVKLKAAVVAYFQGLGTTEDIIADVDRATSNISATKREIEELKQQIKEKTERLATLSKQIDELAPLATKCEQIIQTRLAKINLDLAIQNDNVEKIKFEYNFGVKKFETALFKEFNETFQLYHKSNLSWENINWSLRLVKPNEAFLALSFSDYLANPELRKIDKNSLYGKVFYELFSKSSNFDIYKLLIKKHLYDVSANVDIVGYYGNSPLTSCSFGQRCTAVIVTLLMTGMKPLLIDEPEAHLDNRLIAEYLVNLIQDKKSERQIIFATHNANFVVNGDSELIHILDVPKNKVYTEITSTTIENLAHRKTLLSLEGGEEAFRNRDRKLLSNAPAH
jgi:exonuclease SbcC